MTEGGPQEPNPPTPAAKRMRRYRRRLREGSRPAITDIRAEVVAALIEQGWTSEAEIRNPHALGNAIADLAECWAEGRLTCPPLRRNAKSKSA